METVFISSTIHDLKDLRDHLDHELRRHGYKTLLSEKGTIPVDSSKHSYADCIRAAQTCDFLIAIIDGRFGGVVPTTNKSITVSEIEAALDAGKQVYVFVRQSVWDAKEVLKPYSDAGIRFRPSNVVKDSRVFEMLDVIRQRGMGNWIFQFNLPTDIISKLSQQRGFTLQKPSAPDTDVLDKIIVRKTLELFPDQLIPTVCSGFQSTTVSANAVDEFCDAIETFNSPRWRFAGVDADSVFGKFLELANRLIAKSTAAFHVSSNSKFLTIRDWVDLRPIDGTKYVKEMADLAVQTWEAWEAYYAFVRTKWPDLVAELHQREASKLRASKKSALEIEFEKGIHLIRAGNRSEVSFTVRNLSSDRIDGIHVQIVGMLAIQNKAKQGQNAAQFTGHTLARMRNPNPKRQPFSLNRNEAEVISLVWSDDNDPCIHFSGYDVNGRLRKAGFNTLKTRYEIRVSAIPSNAEPAHATFCIGKTKSGTITASRAD